MSTNNGNNQTRQVANINSMLSRNCLSFRSTPVFSGIRVTRSLVFCVVYCRSFSFCPFSFWSRLSLFKLRLLITQTAIIIIYVFIHRDCVIYVGMGSVSVLFLALLSSRVSHLMEVNMSYVGIWHTSLKRYGSKRTNQLLKTTT